TVNFNSLSADQQSAIASGADLYHGLGGSDVVTLPSVANYNVSLGSAGGTLNWDPQYLADPSYQTHNPPTFFAGDKPGDAYTITGGDGRDSIQLGDGNDTVFGSPGNDTIRGGAGAETFDYRKEDYPSGSNQDFGDFSGFASGTAQMIGGGHSAFVTDAQQ